MNSGVNEIIVDQQKKSTELFGLKEPFFFFLNQEPQNSLITKDQIQPPFCHEIFKFQKECLIYGSQRKTNL